MVTMLIYFNLAQNWTQNPFPVKFILAVIKIKVYLIHPNLQSFRCEHERRYSPELLLTVLTSRCDFAKGSPPGLMVRTTQERLKIGTLYT